MEKLGDSLSYPLISVSQTWMSNLLQIPQAGAALFLLPLQVPESTDFMRRTQQWVKTGG
jgi:hypothetical protein